MNAQRVLHRAALASFVVGSGAYHAVAAASAARGSSSAALQVALAVCMLAAWVSADAGPDTRRATLIAGLLARLCVAPITVSEVHDVQRYLWDGALALAGLDPYRVAPDHPAAATLRMVWQTPIEHARYPTLYPPGALLLFSGAASAGVHAAPWVWKALVVGSSLALLWAAERWLVERQQEQHLPLLALSPLLLTECATGAHLDVLCACCVLAVLRHAERRQWLAAGVACGAGVLLKLSPVLLLVPLSLRAGRRGVAALWAGAAATSAGGYGAAYALGLRPLGSLPVFFARWRFGSPVYSTLSTLGPETVAGWLCALALCALVAGSAWLGQRGRWEAASRLALAAPFVVSPVVFPWYLVALVPAVMIAPSWTVLLWMSALPLTYEVVDAFELSGAWQPAAWPLLAIALSWLIGGLLDARRLNGVPWARERTITVRRATLPL